MIISSVAELLKPFVDEERKKLDGYSLEHGPTIGAMYEGLTKELLRKVIPDSMGLQVASGFICHGETMSGEIDCMLVTGTGEQVPYTDKIKWNIKDVIAVLEVKKNISADELSDSYSHLRGVSKIYGDYIQSLRGDPATVNINWVYRVFSQITGKKISDYSELESLPFDLEMIFHTLVSEFMEPVRIVVGHHGWKKEKTLREHIYKLIERRIDNPRGMGAGSFPQLIIGGEHSIVKANGFPYVPRLIKGMWPFLLSSSHNPLRILLELVLTKLDISFNANLAEDDAPDRESMSVCISTRAAQKDGKYGWEYCFYDLKESDLKKRGSSYNWTPVKLTLVQNVAFMKLCRDGYIELDDEEFKAFVAEEGENFESLVESLVNTQLVAMQRNRIVLTTIQCQVVATPEGAFAGENNDGQLTAWANNQLESMREKRGK